MFPIRFMEIEMLYVFFIENQYPKFKFIEEVLLFKDYIFLEEVIFLPIKSDRKYREEREEERILK